MMSLGGPVLVGSLGDRAWLQREVDVRALAKGGRESLELG